MNLVITHTASEGTLIEGTTRGDGSNTILKECGWRWSGQLSNWYVPRSRDTAPKLQLIDATVESLVKAGFGVDVSVNWVPRATADVEQDRHRRALQRATRLTKSAATAAVKSDTSEAKARQISSGIPFGQPILVGHHSESRHRSDLAKIGRAHQSSFEEQQKAEALERAAAIAIANDAGRTRPTAVARRISALEIQNRKLQRELSGYSNHLGDTFPPAEGVRHESLETQLAIVCERLEYWNSVREQQLEAGTATSIGPDNVHKGDLVLYRNNWHAVTRANTKSVSVQSLAGGSWTDTIPYPQLEGHRPGTS